MSAECLLSAHLMVEITLYLIQPGPQTLFCRVPFPQEDLHSLREVTCVKGKSETLRVGV